MNPADRLDCAQLEETRGTVEPEEAKNRKRARCTQQAQKSHEVPQMRETRKARKDAMPHERGSSPVPLPNACALISPIPILASTARQPLPTSMPCLPDIKQTTDTKALIFQGTVGLQGLGVPDYGRLRAILDFKMNAPAAPSQSRTTTGMSRKDAQPLS